MKVIEFKKVSLSDIQPLRTIVNTLTPSQKYSLLNTDNLRQPIEMQLSLKLKSFSQFFSAFSKCRLNFEHFQTKMILIADVFSKLRTPKTVVRSMSKKSRFGGCFDKQHGKWDQILLKSEPQNL